jgi:hypothetical protein
MAPRFPELQDAGWLCEKYEFEGLSSYAIAAELGCRDTTVSRALRRHGIGARMGRPAVVAPGQVYGRLTVLAELPGRTRGRRVFRCLCACGRETEAQAVELRQGKVRSCGCLREETRPSGHTRPPRVHSGQRYGRLVVLHEVGARAQATPGCSPVAAAAATRRPFEASTSLADTLVPAGPARRRRTSPEIRGRWQ